MQQHPVAGTKENEPHVPVPSGDYIPRNKLYIIRGPDREQDDSRTIYYTISPRIRRLWTLKQKRTIQLGRNKKPLTSRFPHYYSRTRAIVPRLLLFFSYLLFSCSYDLVRVWTSTRAIHKSPDGAECARRGERGSVCTRERCITHLVVNIPSSHHVTSRAGPLELSSSCGGHYALRWPCGGLAVVNPGPAAASSARRFISPRFATTG